MHIDALRRHAHLSSMVVTTFDHWLDQRIDIGATVDNGRRHAAVLQRGARSECELAVQMAANTAEPIKLRKARRVSVASCSARALSGVMKVWHHGSARPA